MLGIIENISKRKYFSILGVLTTLICLGYLGSYLKFARPRGFKGDFYAAMYDPDWWDGKGIFYGPFFVFERWIVNSFPKTATVQTFAFICLLIIILSLLLTIRIIKADRFLVIFCFTAWAFNPYLYYSFSVAANPELIELIFLLAMWYAISRKRYALGWVALTLAALTKLVPIIFIPLLLIFFSWSGLIISFTVVVGTMVILSIGQNESILSLISQLIMMTTSKSASNTAAPIPDSEQFLGTSSAIARLLGMQNGQDFQNVTLCANFLVLVLYGLSIWISKRIAKSTANINHDVKVAYVVALFMCLMPFFHLSQTHRHTFIFLAPVWVALRFIYKLDDNLQRSQFFSRFTIILFIAFNFLPLYFLDVYQIKNLAGVSFARGIIPSLLMATEPIWLNLLLLITIVCYGMLITNVQINRRLALITESKE